MKSALLAIIFITPGGSETHWSELAPSVAICHGRAFSLAQWAASKASRFATAAGRQLWPTMPWRRMSERVGVEKIGLKFEAVDRGTVTDRLYEACRSSAAKISLQQIETKRGERD